MSCEKICFPSKKLAELIIANLKKKKREEKSTYFCKECKAWHLSSHHAATVSAA